MNIEIIKPYKAGEEDIKNIIAPAAIEVNQNYLKIGDIFVKTLFIFTYPRYLSTGWFNSIIEYPNLLDISIFAHPVDTALALKKLRNKVTQVESQIVEREDKGLVRDPLLETAYQDIETLRDQLQQAQEKLFDTGVYITIYGNSMEELSKLEDKIVSTLEGQLVYVKPSVFRHLEGFISTIPLAQDKLSIHTPLNTGSLSSLFPFVSLDLTSDTGSLYGINQHNNSLVIFDRFSLENYNQVVFAKAGSGKSYSTKLEILRSLMQGIDAIVIDPENEYQRLSNAINGSVIKISLTSNTSINPFDIPVVPKDEDPADVFKSHILNLSGLIKLMLKEITSEEDSILDRALSETYASRGITIDVRDFSKIEAPLLSDLQTVLENMDGGKGLASRLYKFTQGTYAGFINKRTNVDIENRLVIFSIRDLEEELRPIAMYIVLNYVWNLIRSKSKKRILIIDEAWWMMKYKDSGMFLASLAKRCRKYYLGLTTITQNVEDFLSSPYGYPIISNSSLQLLLKQSPSGIDLLVKTFALSEAEKNLILSAGVGEGIFFIGLKHIAIKIEASYFEDRIITTNPEQLLEMEKE
ncbi:conjugal transfer protein TraC [Candidatus Wolfebacteria bacterium CG10_big_fil_rev_8_21_14_0_10_31_9]|uniref:Conjugal transfer protein TraC n=1 Tax=Candidatus Wolfebacteria bacterium CG10_big_fil_rev_8_21_14_0_10_31_9 TaxID=1975070 RepID=A0A2H0RCY4_9BACT|nr:MAG: conjugal transfer protein TraC [Candidatus Wolfebacteria bacterium CG10_big_fil_rev_8_21_14_0_10_31_9]